MEDLTGDFEQLKISAFSKVQQINTDDIRDITLGPKAYIRKSPLTANKTHKENSKTQNENSRINLLNSDGRMPIRHIIKQMDCDRQREVKSAIENRTKKFEDFSKEQQRISRELWLREHRAFIDNMQQKEMQILRSLEQFDKDCSNQQEKLNKQYEIVEERRKKHQQFLEKERERQEMAENFCLKCQKLFNAHYEEILTAIKSCTNNEELKTNLGDNLTLLKSLPENLATVFNKCKTGFCEDVINEAMDTVTELKKLKKIITDEVELINTRKQEEEKIKHIEPPKYEPPPQAPLVAPTPPIPETTKPQETQDTPDTSIKVEKASLKSLSKYVSISNMATYMELMEFCENYQKLFKQLEDDQGAKQYKFELKKAVNIPVNALSGISAEHIQDKYLKLRNLLAGQIVTVSEKHVSAGRHPQGVAFCMDLLAKKFVLQGDLMVSSNPESAFCYSTLILSLWNDFPDFGKLLLAYFYKYCPYLVPYYIPKAVDESEEEFYQKQGYKYTEGQIEQQDKFLKRMTGIARLYFALMIAKPKGNQQVSPYNLKYGWKWFVSVLKLEPRLDVTATMIHTFLEMVGFQMKIRYGKQFDKLMKILMETYFVKCKENCSGGAGTRLELLLTEYAKSGNLEAPIGYVSYSYW